MSIFIIGEIGINHNGDVNLANNLIKAAKKAGADQAASLEMSGFELTVKYIRSVEEAMGEGKKIILEEEKKNRKKLAPIKKTI